MEDVPTQILIKSIEVGMALAVMLMGPNNNPALLSKIVADKTLMIQIAQMIKDGKTALNIYDRVHKDYPHF